MFPVRVVVCAHYALEYMFIRRQGMCSLPVGVCSRCASSTCQLCALLFVRVGMRQFRVVVCSMCPLGHVLYTRWAWGMCTLGVEVCAPRSLGLGYVHVRCWGMCSLRVVVCSRWALGYMLGLPASCRGLCPLCVVVRARFA